MGHIFHLLKEMKTHINVKEGFALLKKFKVFLNCQGLLPQKQKKCFFSILNTWFTITWHMLSCCFFLLRGRMWNERVNCENVPLLKAFILPARPCPDACHEPRGQLGPRRPESDSDWFGLWQTLKSHGVDSYIARIQGVTTFYCIRMGIPVATEIA